MLTALEMAAVEYRKAREDWRRDGSPCVGKTKERMANAHTLLVAEAVAFVVPECPECHGSGAVPENVDQIMVPCCRCHGTGDDLRNGG